MANQHTIIVPVINTPASMEAVQVACQAARHHKSKVFVVHVIEVNRAIALDARLDAEARRGEQVLRRAEEVAREAGYAIEGELLQSREAGQAIVDEANERDADAIIMGVASRNSEGEAHPGRTAAFVMSNAASDVWVIRRGTRTHHHSEESDH